MLNEKFLQSIADELPDDLDDDEAREVHALLKERVTALQRRRQQAAEEHGLMINMDSPGFVAVRLNLLLNHGLGINTVERFRYELDWIKVYGANIEDELNRFLRMKKAQTLHMPDGSMRAVQPDENGGGGHVVG
jgi:hypothetical protein